MRIYGASAGAHWGSGGQQGGTLAELQEEARRRWRALSSGEQEEAGGYALPTAAQGGEIMGQRFVRPGGRMPALYEKQRDLMMQQTMAGVSADFGRRGMMSSSMYGAATATAGARASLAAWQMWHQERQLNLQRSQFRHQRQMGWAELRQQRAGMRQQWRQWRGAMTAEDDWRAIRQGMGLGLQMQPEVGFYREPRGTLKWGLQPRQRMWSFPSFTYGR